ncbi:MAG TPA: amidase [Solirubrobacteraceae bacterium]|nr:amidase [Solirubrobacteraceae bacterium]
MGRSRRPRPRPSLCRRARSRRRSPHASKGSARTVSAVASLTPGARFRYLEATVAELQAEMAAGRLTARALTGAYIARIRALDRHGPHVGSIIEMNPDASSIARALDRERETTGPRGPLHGIPVLIKDNIATGDRMSTSAGSLALAGVTAIRDAHLVARLRDAGAVILGKTNLSEWANIRSTHSTSGWSARGGQTRNPYALDRNPSGSSSGSAAAVASNFAAVAVATETDGSIVSPANANGVVGIKPTVGLVSRDGIIPISHSQDTAGPMGRTVADAAALLAAIAGVDAHDSATAAAKPADYAKALRGNALKGARLGVVRSEFGSNPAADAVIEDALRLLSARGAELVDPVELHIAADLQESELDVLLTELKAGLAGWLPEFMPQAPFQSLAEVIEWNRAHAAAELRWFGQELFERAQTRGDLSSPEYLRSLAACRRVARREGIDATLRAHSLDALVAPTGGPAWLTDLVNGDHYGGSFSTPAAVAGYPHITVPAGFVHGLPVGISFVGAAWSEARLIGLAHAFERAAKARRAPTFAASAPLAAE